MKVLSHISITKITLSLVQQKYIQEVRRQGKLQKQTSDHHLYDLYEPGMSSLDYSWA